MKRNLQVLALAALLYGTQATADSAFPTPSPDDMPQLSGSTYADRYAGEITSGPSSSAFPVASPEDVPALAGSTRADRYAADMDREPFLGVAGNADLEPLTQWTYADRKVVERNMQALGETDAALSE